LEGENEENERQRVMSNPNGYGLSRCDFTLFHPMITASIQLSVQDPLFAFANCRFMPAR
jgi:hypothetical protein